MIKADANSSFAHGLWADGSCFAKLIPTLQKEGYEVIASQHGLDLHAGDVTNVKRTIAQVPGPVVLVGHSYGGSVITAAGTDSRVAALIYVAAFAPDDDETTQALQEKFPATDIFSHIEVADGRVWLKPNGVPFFAGDLPEHEQKLIWATPNDIQHEFWLREHRDMAAVSLKNSSAHTG
jgi:pimeloyl-ACP methyl ester carboxylesterase